MPKPLKNVPLLILTFASSLVLSNLVLAQSSARSNPVQTRRASSASQEKDDVPLEIKRLENELARAVVARNYAALQRIQAENYVYTDSDAIVTAHFSRSPVSST